MDDDGFALKMRSAIACSVQADALWSGPGGCRNPFRPASYRQGWGRCQPPPPDPLARSNPREYSREDRPRMPLRPAGPARLALAFEFSPPSAERVIGSALWSVRRGIPKAVQA